MTGEAVCAFVVLKQARPTGADAREDREGAARLGRQGDRADRQAQGHPLRRQPAEDALGQDHAPAAALDREGRGDHAGRLDARESGDPRPVETGTLNAGLDEDRHRHCRISAQVTAPQAAVCRRRTPAIRTLNRHVGTGSSRFGRLAGALVGVRLLPYPKATSGERPAIDALLAEARPAPPRDTAAGARRAGDRARARRACSGRIRTPISSTGCSKPSPRRSRGPAASSRRSSSPTGTCRWWRSRCSWSATSGRCWRSRTRASAPGCP